MNKIFSVTRIVILLAYVSYSLLFFVLNLEPDPVISLAGAFFCLMLGTYSVMVLGSGYFQNWNGQRITIAVVLALTIAGILLIEALQSPFREGPVALLYWAMVIAFPALFEFAAHWNRRQLVSSSLA